MYNYVIHGGTITRRHLLSTTQCKLATLLFYMYILDMSNIYKSYNNNYVTKRVMIM